MKFIQIVLLNCLMVTIALSDNHFLNDVECMWIEKSDYYLVEISVPESYELEKDAGFTFNVSSDGKTLISCSILPVKCDNEYVGSYLLAADLVGSSEMSFNFAYKGRDYFIKITPLLTDGVYKPIVERHVLRDGTYVPLGDDEKIYRRMSK